MRNRYNSLEETEPLAPGLDEDEHFVDPVAQTSRLEDVDLDRSSLPPSTTVYRPRLPIRALSQLTRILPSSLILNVSLPSYQLNDNIVVILSATYLVYI